MKKKVVLLLALAVVLPTLSETSKIDGITWAYTLYYPHPTATGSGKAEVSLGWSSTTPTVSKSTDGVLRTPSSLIGCPVTRIADYAFSGCDRLTSVTIQNGVGSIGNYAFRNCSALKGVTIPASVTNVGDYVFYNCSSLTNIVLPEGISRVGNRAFYNCYSLTSVTMPTEATSIGDYAFFGCRALKNIGIPDAVTNIGYRAFSCCSELMSIDVGDNNSEFKSVDGVLYSKDGRCLIAVPGKLPSVNIPDGVTNIDAAAFVDCYSLTSVTIPNSVTDIGAFAFYGCSGLTSVNIPDSVVSIGGRTFDACTGLESVTIPQYVCNSQLRTIFPSSYSSITNVIFRGNVSVIGGGAFEDCYGLEELCISSQLEYIGTDAFKNCGNLQRLRFYGDEAVAVGELPNPYCRAMKFKGWYSEPEGGGVKLEPNEGGALAGSVYYAHWVERVPTAADLCIPDYITVGDGFYEYVANHWDELVTAVYDQEGEEMSAELYIYNMDILRDDGESLYYNYNPKAGQYSVVIYDEQGNGWTVKTFTIEKEYWSGYNGFYCTIAGSYVYSGSSYSLGCFTNPEVVSVGGWDGGPSVSVYDYYRWTGDFSRGCSDPSHYTMAYYNYNDIVFNAAGRYVIEISTGDTWWEDDWTYCYLSGVTESIDVYVEPLPLSSMAITAESDLVYTGEEIANNWFNQDNCSFYDNKVRLRFSDITSLFVEMPGPVTNAGTYHVAVGADMSDYGYTPPNGDDVPSAEHFCRYTPYIERHDSYGYYYNSDWHCYAVNYIGVTNVAYTVHPRPVAEEQTEIVLPSDLVYDGNAKSLAGLTITNDYNGVVLQDGVDYDVVYSDNVNPGVATATVTCKGNYTGTFTRTFEILPTRFDLVGDGSGGGFTGESGSVFGYDGVYDGEGHGATVDVRALGDVTARYALAEDGPYVDSLLFTNVCDQTVWVELSAVGYNSFTGSVKVAISPRSLDEVTIESQNTMQCPGNEPVLSLAVNDSGLGRVLVRDLDYTAVVVNDETIGKTEISVQGKGNYEGERFVDVDYLRAFNRNGVTWLYWPTDGKAWISSARRDEGASPSVVVIPDTLGGLPVEEIPNGLLRGFSGVAVVVVGANVKSFGNSVFYGCSSLKYVVFAGAPPKTRQRWEYLGDDYEPTERFVSVFEGAPANVRLIAAGSAEDWPGAWPVDGDSRSIEDCPSLEMTPKSGKKSGRLTVTMALTGTIPELEIRYTTDGSEPVAESALYEKRFTISVMGLVSVKAAPFLCGVRIGGVVEERYSPVLNDVLNIGNIIAKDGSAPLDFDLDPRHQWWSDETETSFDGSPSMKSGRIGNDETSWMSATFSGAGVFEFSWKSSCEKDDLGEFFFDHAVCELDGEEVAWIDGVSSDWVREIVEVKSDGVHMVRWTYVKDDADDLVYPGDDCVWVDGVKFSYPVYVSFSPGEGGGDAPNPITSSIGYEVTLPDKCDMAFAKHSFAGWNDGENVYLPGTKYLVGMSDVTMTAVWEAKVLAEPVIYAPEKYDGESSVVSISAPENADAVYYTTDGSEPDATTAALYVAPFVVTGTTTIKAVAVADDWFDSGITEVVTTRSWTSLEDCLGAAGFVLSTGGDANWIGDALEGCVKTAGDANGWFSATFHGAGVATYLLREGSGAWVRHDEVFAEDGEHILRWEGKDLAVKALELLPVVTVSFCGGDDVLGELPSVVFTAQGREIAMPPGTGISRARHVFAGWSDGERVFVVGEPYEVGANDICLNAVWDAKILDAPTILVADRYDGESTIVEIVPPSNADAIYYTTDGSDPIQGNGFLYTSPFQVAGTTTIKAVAIAEDWFDGNIAEATTFRTWGTINDCLDNQGLEFSTGGDANWSGAFDSRVCGRTSFRSGKIGDGGKTWVRAVANGAGRLTFWWRSSCEGFFHSHRLDGAAFLADGEEMSYVNGETAWRKFEIEVDGDGEHVFTWIYSKDVEDAAGNDCVWLDAVAWVPCGAAVPSIAGDENAILSGDAANGYTVVAGPGNCNVSVSVPSGVDASKVTVEVSPDVERVRMNGSALRICRDGCDITPYLDVPTTDDGEVALVASAKVKEAYVKEPMDPANGAIVVLDPASPVLTTPETRPGLTYTLHEGTTLENMNPGDSKVGDGRKWTPNVTVKGGTSGFYTIKVEK